LPLYRRHQYPKFTKTNGKENQMENKESQRQLPTSGWNKNGLETFNELAREVLQNRKKHGVEFDKAFKISCEKAKMSCTNTTRKRKRSYIDT
jgi:aldehyde:ferredoxin oxidoreductase